MTLDGSFVWLAGGIVALLALASAVGATLRRAVVTPQARATVQNLNDRIRSWWIMAAIFAAVLAAGTTATMVLFALISFLALREFLTLIRTRPGDRVTLFLSFFVVIPAQYVLIAAGWYGLFAIFIPVYVFLALPVASAVGGDTRQFLARSAVMQWGLMLAVYAISHAAALLILVVPGHNAPPAMLLLYLVVVVQLSDVFQYVVGKLFGRRPVAPRLSPSKTVEGLIGGGALAIACGTGLWFVTPFSPLQSAAMSTVIVVAGFFGSLVLSAIKRDLGVKDWGQMIGGHGGMLDRVDSIAFAAPLFFHVTRYFFT
ncbi:MAG: phosphatidate cytidylyltransferase [Alphaproteobacteria bacterium]